jgi:hypothetical protein
LSDWRDEKECVVSRGKGINFFNQVRGILRRLISFVMRDLLRN